MCHVLFKKPFSKTEFWPKACAPVAKGLGGDGGKVSQARRPRPIGARCPRPILGEGDTRDIAEPTYKGFNQLLDKNPTAYKGFNQLEKFQPTY